MSRPHWILVTLLAYQMVLVVIGVWAHRRTRDTSDFFLGGRQLGSWVAAISASASSSSAWTLLGVSGAAFSLGAPAVWLFPATVCGFLINWLWVAPRLMAVSRDENALTLTEVIAGDRRDPLHPTIVRVASGVILFSFVFYVAAQFQAAGNAFATSFHLPIATSIVIGAAVIVLYTWLGGFWAVSVTDTVQGLLMVGAAVVLPVAAVVAVGGPRPLWGALHAAGGEGTGGWPGPGPVWVGIAFVAGTLGIGLGYPGQPHVVNRFMALRDRAALAQGRVIAIAWAMIIYAGTLIVGWCGRILISHLADGEQIFFALTDHLLTPVVAGIMIAAVLSAIMSTADSQLLVAASSISHDLSRTRTRQRTPVGGLARSRWVVTMVSALAVALALMIPDRIFSRVLFAWHAVGSAFGPVLLIRLSGRRVRSAAILSAICCGFGLTVIFHLLPDTPADVAERLAPFVVALAIAAGGAGAIHDHPGRHRP
ncbi:MAG: sodium/proline symporter [Acidobacteriota bacterium]